MLNQNLKRFIAQIPKCENHIHLEGSIYPEMLVNLAQKNGIPLPFESVENTGSFYEFQSFEDFERSFIYACSTLITADDFAQAVLALAAEGKEQNILYREVMFSYSCHQIRGIPLNTVLKGMYEGREEARKRYGVELDIIADIDRTLPAHESLEFVESVVQYKDEFDIIGVGLDAQEYGFPADLHTPAFAKAKEHGLTVTAHAGELDGYTSVYNALNAGAERIDHGVRAIEDEELCIYLAEKQIPLTVCPISNVRANIFESIEKCPISEFMQRDMLISINSDDPAFFRSNLIDNYMAVADAFKLNRNDIVNLAKNSFKITRLDQTRKNKYLQLVDDFVDSFIEEP